MGCVNKSSKEFKDLSARNNVDSNTLELITHKYWLQTGNETLFPTDVYIQAQLGNSQYKEPGKYVRKMWEKHYSSSQEFTSLSSLETAYDEASKYFPKSAIVYYKNAKGNFVLSVKRPVEKTNYSKDDFFDDYDNIGSMRDVKILNLGIEDTKTYGIGKVQELYNKFNTDRTSQALADKVFSIARDLGINVTFNESLPFGTMGRYSNDNTIVYKKSFLERDIMNGMKASILLHEVLHSLSMYALSKQTKNWKRPEALEEFRTEMNSLYQDLKSNPALEGERGVVDLYEFVAELANPVFRNKIQQIDKEIEANRKANQSFWGRILDAFKNLLGIHTSNTYYERSMNALDKALNAFDIDTYMRYNGIKNSLRKKVANIKVPTQLNKRIDVINNAIKSEKWTSTALRELNNLVNDLEDGKITYQRFPKEATRGWHQGGRANEAASILLGANEGSSTKNPRSFSEKYERDKREQPIQERIIETWAKAAGIWHNNLDTVEGKEFFAEGGEAKVFANTGDTKVTKILSTEYFITPQFALDRITLHNTLFPIAPLEIIGFGRNSQGEFQFLVEQPFIQGEPASQKEINEFITKAGFTKSKKDKGNTFVSDDLYISDLHDENVIKTPNGILVVIDADLRLNTPDLNRNGKYEINNNIVSMKEANANEFIRTLTPTQLDEETKLIKQENADYNLINDVEEEHKKSSKAVPQDFTFNDGVTVKAPFMPNEQQIDALNAMSDFIKSDETSMTLSGYAGTGKTSLMEMIAKKCQKQYKPVMFCATTNKAAAVLNDRVSKAGFKATTLNKTFGINVEVDPNSKSYNARNLVNNLKDVDIIPRTTIIIDEASMINEENYRILNKIAKDNGLKIIYVGDEAQLAPVNEDQISKVFRNGDGKVVTLTQVERTDDNAILKEATDIRNGKPLSGETSFNSKGEGVAYISPEHQDAINEVVAHYVKGLKKDPNYFRILAYTNKAVSNYNNQVRELLGYTSPIPQVGEPMTGYANWGYDWKTKSYRFINSESYKVLNTGKSKTVSTRLDDGTLVTMEAIPITLEDSLGNRDTFDFMDIKSNPQNRLSAMTLANEKKRLWAAAKRVYGRQAKAEIYAKINALDSFLFVNDNLEDNDHNLLQAKTIDFGYALTIHKSQGSTFTNVLMDDVDVSKASMNGNNASNAMETVDLGEENNNDASNAELRSSEDVDLGDLSDVVVEPIVKSQVANVKQQLEYVGVSRATDTVTIVSNHIKKEGSPLNPSKDVKEDTIKENDNRSNNSNKKVEWARNSNNNYEVSTAGDKRFSALNATFKPGTIIEGIDVGGKTIENVYQSVIKKSGKGKAPAKDSILNIDATTNKGTSVWTTDLRNRLPEHLDDRVYSLYVFSGGERHSPLTKEEKEDISYYVGYLPLWKEWAKQNPQLMEELREKAQGKVLTDRFANTRVSQARALSDILNTTDNNGTEYKQTDEFRRVQEGSKKFLEKGISDFNAGRRSLNDQDRERIGGILGRLLESNINGSWYGVQSNLTHVNKDGSTGNFNIGSVDGKLFHDIFEVTRTYLYNGELVDLHDDYSDCNCYVTSDGLCGFAIEPDGNLVSVYSLSPRTNKGFLYAIKDFIKQEGATHLDAYESRKQPLQEMYSKTLGFHTAATMDYNMEYDHDDIAKNHGNPQVVFMVDHEVAEPKHFDKNSYDEAKEYQMKQIINKSVNNLYSEDGKSPLTMYRGYAMTEDREASNIEETIGHTAVDYHDSLKGAYYFTSSKEEAQDYAKSRTDKSDEEFYRDGKLIKQRNRHYTGDFAKVSTYHISANAKVEHYEDMRDFSANGKTSNADVIILKHGTMWRDNKEYIVRNPSVIVNSNQTNQEEASKIENPTFENAQSYTVKLSYYEGLNEYYSNTIVDAEWKIPYLKELDAQLSMDNSREEDQNIINQMNTVLQATSKEEYLQEVKASKTNNVQKTLDEYDKIIQQFDNLLEGGNEDYKELGASISASEIRHTAELIVNSISDEITRLQKEEGLAKKLFPSLNTTLDFQTATRKQIVETVGINRLIDRAKALFDSENADYDDLDVSMQADLITDNWDAFMLLASDVFAFNEGFGITKDYSKGNFATTDNSKIDYDNFNDYSNDEDVAAENGEKDEQEHWQIESKTIDVLNSMSALVRQGIHECYLLDESGNKVLSKWGIAERVNPRNAVNSILRWTQGALSLNDMIAKMSEKKQQNPWLSQLIDRLSDKSGKETDFQSQFYGVFSKHFQAYSIVLQEDGKYYNMPANNRPALREAMQTITSQFKIGEHPLFNDNKVNAKLLGNENTVNKNADFNLHKALTELREVTKALKQGEALDDEMSQIVTDNIVATCRVLGYYIMDTMLSDVINTENIQKLTEYLGYIVKSLDNALKAQNRGELKDYNPFGFGKQFSIDGSLKNFLTPITDQLEDTAINAFYDSGKMYQSYVTPSFMTKLMKKFHQEGQAFEDFMWNEYGSSEWFAFDKTGEFDRLQWRNEWLRLLAKDENARKVFEHKVELNFNKHNYMRNMTDTEYTLSLITEYFAESTNMADNMAPAWFRIPMQSNKPSSDFIKFYSYRGNTYKNSIVSGLHGMFLQELSRIQTMRMRNLSKNDADFIKNFDSNGRKFNFLPVFNAYLENTPSALAKREQLHNIVEYDEDRFNELRKKEEVWKEAYDNNIVDADGNINLTSDEDLKDMQLTPEEQIEYNNLKALKEVNKRALTTEEDGRFAHLLQKKLAGEEALTAEEEVQLGNLADKIIRQSVENRVQSILSNWESNGIIEAAKKIKGIYPSNLDNNKATDWVKSQVENFLWNDTFASKNILQLTIGDIAFYKDTEDLQKRLAQLHAPGTRGNIYATDYNGNRVSDGKYRTFILQDFDSFKSNIIANISEVFDRKIASAPESQKAQMIALKESLVGKDGKYTKINVTDAQGYSSPSSYRKKAFIFGRWSRQAEDIYQKLSKGEYNYTDLETAFQPLKPFVYTKLTKNMGVDNAPIHSMQVPFQAKNAEYLLIMADAILKGEQLSRPNLLRAVYRVMEDSERLNPTKGIDTVQFESAIKSGLQGKMNIFQYRNMPGGEEAAYTFMMNQIYKDETDAEGKRVYKNYNTDTFVHEASFNDYCLQQEIPEHFKEHSQAHGSQIRMITPSDLDLYTTDENGNQVDNYYEWTEPDGTHRKLKADEFRKEYEQTIADNIEESINNLAEELHFNSQDKKERNIALSKILQREVLSSPRYGVDLIQACAIDKETGEFRIPKGDPIQAKRIEQLINSIIKNRVNKQKIAGGPIVQVSNFGTSRQLHIRFNDKQGNLIPLEVEYDASKHDNLSYKEYIKKNQGGIAYFEVFCPIWSNELYDKFSNPDGTINVDAINTLDPELLKMVSYRIPTEDKYSCAPMKVVGFMPREAGDAIMLPYELTEIDDSDFDVDKRYVMRKDIPIKTKKVDEYIDQLTETGKRLYKEIMGTEATTGSVAIGDKSDYVEKMVDSLIKNPTKFPKNSPFRKALYAEYQKLAYKTEAPTSGRLYRDNKIIDMTYAVLTNQMTADKILNPGGFDAPKKMGYMVAAYKNPANRGLEWSDLEGMSIDELKDLSYTDKDLTYADTQVQFYKQNSAAASLIGVFAVNKVAHATLESNGIYLDVAEICGNNDFTIANTTFGGRMEIDGKYDSQGTLIGKTLGSLVSASADAVKDPILNLMNVNMTTAGMLNTMLRLGMPFNDAALFLSQDIIERMLNQFNRENLSNYVTLDSIIDKWMIAYRQKNHLTTVSNLDNEPLTKGELIYGLTDNEHDKIDYKVLLAFQKMRNLVNAMRKPTFATRFNSISSAVGPLIIDNLIIEHKMESFTDANSENGTHFYTYDGDEFGWMPVDIDDIFADHPILKQFSRTVDIAKSMFSDMPTGSTGFRNLLGKLPKDISNKMYNDKKLMDQFSNFYQSYLLMQSGMVKSSWLKDYATRFPKWFIDKKFKEKYQDNALIQAIRMNVSKKSGRPYLMINITGMDEQKKEELRSAWIDLHKEDPELSQMLFNYSFFRAGIGFSPKTFMSLVPTYVKERLKSKDGSTSYVDTYRNFPDVVPELVIDQFIRNNWDNSKLVYNIGGKEIHYNANLKTGTLKIYRPEDIAALSDTTYIKTSNGVDTYLWHLVSSDPTELTFQRIKPLGNNGEYLEMSLNKIVNPISETFKVVEDNSPSDIKTESPQEANVEETTSSSISDTEATKNVSELVDLLMKQNPKFNKETASNKVEEIKNRGPKFFAAFLQNVFKHKGLELNKEEAIKEFEKYC